MKRKPRSKQTSKCSTVGWGVLFLCLGLQTGCAPETPRELVRKEKEAGRHWQQCELAKQSVRADRSLLVSLGECYEHGWGALAQDNEAAVNYYEQGARWGDSQAITALKRLGVKVPEADLLHEAHKHLDEKRTTELKHTVLLTLLGTEKGIAKHPNYRPKGGPLGNISGANIADSPAFVAYLEKRSRKGMPPPCADVYIKGQKADSWGNCQ